MKRNSYILNFILLVLICLWIYTAVFKLGNMTHNLDSMRKQIFPLPVANFLAYAVPITALLTAGVLLYNIRLGLWLSIGFLSSISLYIIIYLTELVAEKTCSCAGIFPKMEYEGHLIFNILMIGLVALGLRLYNKTISGVAENRIQSRQHN